jgi:hypothetical protein
VILHRTPHGLAPEKSTKLALKDNAILSEMGENDP